MNHSTVELELPAEIIEEAQGIARVRNRSLESVLQDSLSLIFDTSADCEDSAPMLNDLSDEKLWEIVNRRMPWAQDSRLRELSARGKEGDLAENEHRELEDLLAELDRHVVGDRPCYPDISWRRLDQRQSLPCLQALQQLQVCFRFRRRFRIRIYSIAHQTS